MDNSFFIEMRFLRYALTVAWLVLKLTLVMFVVSAPVSFFVVDPMLPLLLTSIEFLENLQSPLFLDIPIVHKLRMVERYVRQRLAKIIQPVHFVHELCRDFVSEVFVIPDDPNACSRRDSHCFGDA
jgi:hypothetical protein